MKIPLLDKVARRFTKTASDEVRKEVKKTAIDLIPGILTIGSMIVGIFVFHETSESKPMIAKPRPSYSTTKITTNNYFLGNVSDDVIKKILEAKHYD